jgi:hypothetical protein
MCFLIGSLMLLVCFKKNKEIRRTDCRLLLYLNSTDKISQQPENCENRNDPDLVQAFLKKWWVESDFKAPNLPLSLRFKGNIVLCKDILFWNIL